MPDQFWSLTVREFYIKHAAFSREQDRQRALVWEHASLVGQFKKQDQRQIARGANTLRRYPLKPWMQRKD